MPIHYVQGDLLESGAEVLVNPVNCHGVMGKGLALQFKSKFPSYYQSYRHLCNDGMIRLGRVNLYTNQDNGLRIASFPTKNHWSDVSILDSIDHGLRSLSDLVDHFAVKSIAIPMIGCGEGKLSWDDVRPLIIDRLGDKPACDVYVYGPML